MHRLIWIAICAACSGAAESSRPLPSPASLPDGVEAMSLLGAPLARPALAGDERAKREAALATARAQDLSSIDNTIWVGRRLGYLHRYREAIAWFDTAIAANPREPRLRRHRGHRFITVRMIQRAIDDLSLAAVFTRGVPDELEPDGMPNPSGIPTSTTQGNIYYHLGLAQYLDARYADAAASYREGMRRATTDDMKVAFAYWLYLALRHQGQPAEAAAVLAELPATPTILENDAYLALVRLFRKELTLVQLEGESDLDRTTIGYGIAAWLALEGQHDAAQEQLRSVVANDAQWPAFGYIAAEAALAREARSKRPDPGSDGAVR